MSDLIELPRDQFDGRDQLAKPARPTRRCTTCGEPESKRRDLRATQYRADLSWQNTVHWSCQPCRRKWQGGWRVPSYHPQTDTAPFECYAAQLVADVRAITLLEPWAWLVVNGFKDCENRKWQTQIHGRIFIHSARAFTDSYSKIENWVGTHLGIMLPGKSWLQANHMGRLVGVAEFAPMVSHMADSQWKMKGQWAWPIRWCHAIKPSDPVRGMQGLWHLPTDNMRINVAPI